MSCIAWTVSGVDSVCQTLIVTAPSPSFEPEHAVNPAARAATAAAAIHALFVVLRIGPPCRIGGSPPREAAVWSASTDLQSTLCDTLWSTGFHDVKNH